MPTYKLRYFDAKGRAEVARLLFAASGVSYKDERINSETWAKFKPDTPTQQLPCLEVDGHLYCQSVPIAMYLATVFGLHGRTALEQLQVNQIVCTANDLLEVLAKAMFESDECKKAELTRGVKEETIPKFSVIFETFLTKSEGCYFVEGKLTLADITVYAILERCLEFSPDFMENKPNLKKNFEAVEANAGIKKWLEKRPKTNF